MKYSVNDQQISVEGNDGQSLVLTIITDSIIRVFQSHGEQDHSYAIEGQKQVKTNFTVNELDEGISIKTTSLVLNLNAQLKLDVFDSMGHPLVLGYHGERHPLNRHIDAAHAKLAGAEGHSTINGTKASSSYYEVVKQLADDEQIYGLGDKTGFLNKRHYEYDNWNTDNPSPHVESFTRLYKSIPFILGLKNGHPYGLFFDNPYRSHFDLGKESDNYYFYSAVNGNLDYYVIGGRSLKEIVTNYTYLTGRVPLPQKWTLGYQQSRWGYSVSQSEVERIAEQLRHYDLPCDVIHFDIDYMDGYRVFTWDKQKFPDPKAFVEKLRKHGFRVMPIIDPGVKVDDHYHIYQEGLKKGYFVKNPDGTVYVNKVWPGDAVFPDFGREKVRQWWADNCKFLVDLGTCGIWNDMNELATFNGEIPDDVQFSDEQSKSTHAKMHNVYGHNMAKASYEGVKKYSGKRPYIITRAAYAGTQKYSTIWTGDNQSLWSHLQMMIPQLCNLGMSGFSFAGTDLGGFGADATPELLIRWVEAGVFSPLFRNHAAMGTREQEPWTFSEPTLSIYRKYLRLRYHLIPYLYDLFEKESHNGLPIMRPLVLNYPHDSLVRDMNDEFMVGDELLVAPIVQQGQTTRAAYLPQGEWYDFWTNEKYGGNSSILITAPLDHLPIFVRAGVLLPWKEEIANYISDQPDQVMTFKAFGENAQWEHYQDDGLDFAYQEGQFNRYQVQLIGGQGHVKLTHHGFNPLYKQITIMTPTGRQVFNLMGDHYEIQDDKSKFN